MSMEALREGTPQRYPRDRGGRGVLEETTEQFS